MTKQEKIKRQSQKLRDIYLARLPQRIDRLKSVYAIMGETWATVHLKDLLSEVCKLSGSGTTFGFPLISERAAALETLIKGFIGGSEEPTERHRQEFRDVFEMLIGYLEQCLSGHIEPRDGLVKLWDFQPKGSDGSQLVYILEDQGPLGEKILQTLEGLPIEGKLFLSLSDFNDTVLKSPPDLVICDMPIGKDPLAGLRAIAELRLKTGAYFPIVFASENRDFETRLEAMRIGSDCFFTKPIDLALLSETITSLLVRDSKIPYRILIVDDDKVLSEFYALTLSSSGMEVEVLNDPTKILDSIDSFNPELIILDAHIPPNTGLELAAVIRQTPSYNAIPLVFLSTDSRFDQKLVARNVSNDDFLTKPIRPKRLLISITTRVSKARWQRELNVALKRSVAEAKWAKERALVSSAHKASFLANMSHEIRTPLNGIIGTIQLLESKDLDQEERELVRIQKTSGELLLTVINDILDFSKIEAGKFELEDVATDVVEVVEESVDFFAQKSLEKRLLLSTFIDPNVPRVVISDKTRIKQVLINLISNAIKFTEQGYVAVSVNVRRKSADSVVLEFSVEDTGPGLSQEQQEKLFQAFTQADASTTRKFGGTGLGLSISQRLVELMGGNISLTSALDQGSCFSFVVTLPVFNKASYKNLFTIFAKKKILLVSEHGPLVKHFAKLSEALRFACIPCKSRSRAQKTLPNLQTFQDLDLVILDSFWSKAKAEDIKGMVNPTKAGRALPFLTLGSQSQVNRTLTHIIPPIGFTQILSAMAAQMGLSHTLEFKTNETLPTGKESLQDAQLNLNVLVVEDNEINQQLARKFFAKLGCQVAIYDNGQSAVDEVRENTYDLVFMDCQMPILDGYEATKQIRSLGGALTNIPIIAMTAHAFEGEREKCLNAGMTDYLAKPFQISELAEMLKRYSRSKVAALEEDTGEAAVLSTKEKGPIGGLDFERLALLKEAGEGDEEFLSDMVSGFEEGVPKLLTSLKQALDESDHKSVEFFSHKMRGAASNLGAKELAELCGKIEDLGRAKGDLREAQRLLPSIQDAYGRAAQILREVWLKSA